MIRIALGLLAVCSVSQAFATNIVSELQCLRELGALPVDPYEINQMDIGNPSLTRVHGSFLREQNMEIILFGDKEIMSFPVGVSRVRIAIPGSAKFIEFICQGLGKPGEFQADILKENYPLAKNFPARCLQTDLVPGAFFELLVPKKISSEPRARNLLKFELKRMVNNAYALYYHDKKNYWRVKEGSEPWADSRTSNQVLNSKYNPREKYTAALSSKACRDVDYIRDSLDAQLRIFASAAENERLRGSELKEEEKYSPRANIESLDH